MEDTTIKKEISPITKKDSKKIINQMENIICKIYKNDGKKYTGFLCNIISNNIIIPVLITNNNILDEQYIKENKEIKITINDDKEERIIKIDNNRKIYSSEIYDIIYKNKSIYILQYLNGNESAVSFGIIDEIKEDIIIHSCYTEPGSPIINIENNK